MVVERKEADLESANPGEEEGLVGATPPSLSFGPWLLPAAWGRVLGLVTSWLRPEEIV